MLGEKESHSPDKETPLLLSRSGGRPRTAQKSQHEKEWAFKDRSFIFHTNSKKVHLDLILIII